MLSLPNVRKVFYYNDSENILYSSNRPVVRLQANPDSGRALAREEYQMMWTNINFFKEMAQRNPHVEFIWVTRETLAYWTFYVGGQAVNVNGYLGHNRIGFPRDKLVMEARKIGIDI